ncbi:MAG: response regulator transcription factor [Planctomycetota bacterium]|nr:response regulator transcription factor [Planctomycetota bacterium]
MTRAPARILLVEDHDFVADALKTRLELETDFECVGRLERADDLARAARELNADIVLLDIEMPGSDPFEAIEDLKRTNDRVKVIMLSAHVRDHYINMAVEAGAWGYFYKGDDPQTIVSGIRDVIRGRFATGPKIKERWKGAATQANGRPASVIEGAPRPTSEDLPQTPLASLTPRELQVLRMIGRGMARREIAESLHRSPKTVDCHRAAIMKKLEIRDRVELARYAIREGLAEA